MNHSRKIILYAFGWFLILSACSTTFPALKAVNPPVGPYLPGTAESIQPTFKWSPSSEPDIRYDLIVYECVETVGGLGEVSRIPGKEIYYRTSIDNTEHRLEMTLKPSTKYFWSVRTRNDGVVGPWSRYNYFLFLGTGWVDRRNQPFLFQTPER